MSVRPGTARGVVRSREQVGPDLVRVVVDGIEGWSSTGIPDEWVALTVPGQFQTRYYTVRHWSPGEVTLDVVLHAEGLVADWVRTDCVGDEVGIGAAKGSFALPDDAAWVVLAGDLTALPAVARILEGLARTRPDLPATAYVEAGTALPDYLPAGVEATWVAPPEPESSGLADLVGGIAWPEGPGYFWMAGESAQMRRIRTHARRELGWESRRLDVMGYWSGSRSRQRRAVDPGPIYARGKARGLSDEQIWAEYDRAREGRGEQ